MPWKLILFILILVAVALFASLNLENRTDISFGFHVFKGVPIFLSLFFSFLAGALLVLPFAVTFSWRKTRKKKEKERKWTPPPAEPPAGAQP